MDPYASSVANARFARIESASAEPVIQRLLRARSRTPSCDGKTSRTAASATFARVHVERASDEMRRQNDAPLSRPRFGAITSSIAMPPPPVPMTNASALRADRRSRPHARRGGSCMGAQDLHGVPAHIGPRCGRGRERAHERDDLVRGALPVDARSGLLNAG